MEVAASVIAIIQIAKTVGGICGSYIRQYHDAPKDLRSILIEVGSIKAVLEVIQLLHVQTAKSNSPLLHQIAETDGPLTACRDILHELLSLFPKQEVMMNGGRKFVLGPLERLRWSTKANEVRRLLTDLGKLKSTLSLMLTSDTVVDMKDIKANMHQIQHRLSEKDKQDMLKWLVTTDPSPNHNAAVQLHEEHTGTWLLRSREYAAWLTGQVPLFWVYGIPGAGKTVLLSFIAISLQKHCNTARNAGMAFCYYYCYFGRSQDETPHLLRWAISQLCRQSGTVPAEVVKLFGAGTEPAVNELISALSAVVQPFDAVFLLVDALDETQNQTRLASTLMCLRGSRFPNVRVLATSRQEPDIERVLQKEQSMSLLNPLVDEDIRLYIGETLRSDPRFRRWQPVLVSAVEDALIAGAKGMFRWVACQLDILRRLTTEAAIYEALGNLPKTLDETYERILLGIPECNRQFAKRALQWMSYPDRLNGTYFSSAALAAAVTMPCRDGDLRWENQLLDISDLQDICTCLAEIPEVGYEDDDLYFLYNKKGRLSHYTVKEFLISDRIQQGPASYFHISQKSTLSLLAETVIGFLLHFDPVDIGYSSDTSKEAWHRFQRPAKGSENRTRILTLSAFYAFSIGGWPKLVKNFDDEGGGQEVFGLLFDLLDPRRPDFEQFRDSSNTAADDHTAVPDWMLDESNWAKIILLSLVFLGLPRAAIEWLKRNNSLKLNNPYIKRQNTYGIRDDYIDCPFLLACDRGLVDLIRYCIVEGRVDYDNRDEDDNVCPMGLIVGSDMPTSDICDLVQLMVSFGAKVNPVPDHVAFTPLQIAVGWHAPRRISVTRLLLQCGADPNVRGLGEWNSDTSRFWDSCGGLPFEVARNELRPRHPKEDKSIQQEVIDLLLQFGAREELLDTSSGESSNQDAMETDSDLDLTDS